MGTNDMYPVHTGYLTKSPPETRVNFKRWMKRWFVLWEDKSLQYYKERGDTKPKKTIDLSQCEFLDTNLMDKKFKNIFSIKIQGDGDKDNGRTYYLAAETPYEMNKWVENICNLCDFKATETNNNNKDKTIRHKAPLEKQVMPEGKIRGSSFIEPDSGHDSDTSDLVHVKVNNPEPYDDVPPPRPYDDPQRTPPDYDQVPAPRPVNEQYSVPPQHPAQSPRRSPVSQRNSCPLDTSSSETSLSSTRRSSGGSDVYQNYDVPLNQPTYDIPPSQPTYDYPPGDVYDVPPSNNGLKSSRYSGGSSSEDGTDIYDVPPLQPTYDTLPAPGSVSTSSTMPGMVRLPYNSSKPVCGINNMQYGNYDSPGRLRLQKADSCTLPPGNAGPQSVYDQVPLKNDMPASNYDWVPPPKPYHEDSVDGRMAQNGIKPYVNLIPGEYAKPLPSAPDEYAKPLPSAPNALTQRDSGTGLDEDEAVYDVPPIQPALSAPSVDRRNKPSIAVAPKVDRTSKPSLKGRDYVNLQRDVKRATTIRESSNRPPIGGGNVQRSKSSVANYNDNDGGYLYMESPKRTESSTRYSKKNRKLSIQEEDETYEYMCAQTRNEQDKVYENTSTQMTPKKDSSPERTTPLRGHYQDITVVCQNDGPTITQRSPRTQYTTIDLEKTKGFQKTREEAEKGQ